MASHDVIADFTQEPLDEIRAQVKTLCAQAPRDLMEDWRAIMQVVCDMVDAHISAQTQLELLTELRLAREPLRQTQPKGAPFILAYLEWMLADSHRELGNETAAKQHLRQGRDLIDPLKVFVARNHPGLLPYVQFYVSGMHETEAELHYGYWSRRGDPKDVERAITSGRLAYNTVLGSAKNSGDPHHTASVRAKLAGYLARSALQLDNTKRKRPPACRSKKAPGRGPRSGEPASSKRLVAPSHPCERGRGPRGLGRAGT